GPSGQLLSQTIFAAPAIFQVSDTELAAYLLDTWRIAKGFQLSLGIRDSLDHRVRGQAWSPRLGFSWSPFSSSRTRISGGYAITHDQIALNALSRPLDQIAETTQFSAAGIPTGSPVATSFSINAPLALPRAANWTLNVDHQISNSIYASAKYLRRRGTDGLLWIDTLAAPLSLLPLPGGASGGLFDLSNLRRDSYDSGQISLRQTFAGQHEWMISYTRSRAITNTLIDPDSPQPLQLLPGFVPMPWDAPNRLLAFAYLPVPSSPSRHWTRNWSIAILSDMRSGFPFSVRQPDGLLVGQVDSLRFPRHFDLDLAIERIVTLRGYRFALRGGMDNVTNQANPTAVNNVTGVPQFLTFLGQEGRHFVVRVRFFGHEGAK
ncbi:MAG TPA: hypothetical protein VKS01_01565, partial [Bryobacteraceae bacterium]|nr:hypothetical protein [Bryobacteraceae bacterium]